MMADLYIPPKPAIIRATELPRSPAEARGIALREAFGPAPVFMAAGAMKKRGAPTATIFSVAMDADSNGWSNWTLRPRIAAAALAVPDFEPTHMRIMVEASSGRNLQFSKWYVGHVAGSGDAWDAASLTQILWSGNANGTVPAGNTLISDWTSFAWNKTSALLFPVHVNGNASNDGARHRVSAGGNFNYYYKSGDFAATANDSGYTTVANTQIAIRAIEVMRAS